MEPIIAIPKPRKERKVKGMVEIDFEKCKGCELCTIACKEDALFLSKNINLNGYRYIVSLNENCTGCVNCALVCPDAVITVYRTNPKKKISSHTENIRPDVRQVISTPVYTDLQNMDYI